MSNNFFKKIISTKNKRIIVIAEMSGNHQRKFISAKKFIDNAIKYGADVIKFQVYKPETITLNSKKKDFLINASGPWKKYDNLYNLYENAYTPWEWISELAKFLNKKQFPWFASPFDSSSVEFLQKLNCQAYKLASPEITDIPLVEKILSTKKPIIISTGLATLKDIDLVVKTIKKKKIKYAILKCVTSYPSPKQDLNLSSIQFIKNRYKCSVGFSDHSIGDLASKVAVSQGAMIIEKHFKIDSDKTSIDSHFSMKLSSLTKFKKDLKDVKIMLGKNVLKLSPSAKKNINSKRSIYVYKKISKGEKFNTENIRSIRPGFSLHPKYLKNFIGNVSLKNLEPGDRVRLSYIDLKKK